MGSDLQQLTPSAATGMIRCVRGVRVMLDSDLAALYGVTSNELASKIAELQRSSGSHEAAIRKLFAAVDHLLGSPSDDQERREIGFHIKEKAWKYRTRNGARNGVH